MSLFIYAVLTAVSGGSAAVDRQQRVIRIDGEHVRVVNSVMDQAQISRDELSCYDIVLFEADDSLRVGFVPRVSVNTRGGRIEIVPDGRCREQSFLVSPSGEIIRQLRSRH